MRFSVEKLSRLTPPEGLPDAAALLGAVEYHRDSLCADVFKALLPRLDAICPPPEGGWLLCAYEALCHGLFPDPAYAPPSGKAQAGLKLLIGALQMALDGEDAPADPLLDLLPFDESLRKQSRVREEYRQFVEDIRSSKFLLTLRLGREVMPFDPASHTIGVRNLAVHAAQLAHEAGLPVDVPLVAAAALCHDIGKFGCRGEDARRIPYLHYYYTWQWLSQRGLEQIAHVSANHSTWDLEFENLPVESLLLIYADFRVRGTRENGKEVVRIYSLAQAYDMIMSKLSDMTPQKKLRYELVYSKLRDFEWYLHHRGVATELSLSALPGKAPEDTALLTDKHVLDALRDLTFDNNIRLMHTISTDSSFDLLLEQARGERDPQRIRTYLRLFEEYNTYMTRGSKQKLLVYLYELLMHPAGDIRRISGTIMGEILANSGPKYRKELPADAPKSAVAPTMLALLEEAVALWDHYIQVCLFPDHKIAQKHALRISNSLKTISFSLFSCCEAQHGPQLAQKLFDHLPGLPESVAFVVLDCFIDLPIQYVTPEMFSLAEPELLKMLRSATPRWQVIALRALRHLKPLASEALLAQAQLPVPEEHPAVTCLRRQLAGLAPVDLEPQEVSAIYLSNLKNAVHWTIKNVQIDMLCRDVEAHPENAYHTATHLSNLLSVSEHLPVREHAGASLLALAPGLTVDQRNELCVDLMRELENGQEQIVRFIPEYLGKLLCTLPEKEILEAIQSLEALLRSGSKRSAEPVLMTFGALISYLPSASTEAVDYCLGLLLTGIAHYDTTIHRSALTVLCHNVIANEALSNSLRSHCFTKVCKKLLVLLSDPAGGQLTFFNRAAMLNHLYRFMVRHEIEIGPFDFPQPKPVAFFPGTFDPFSAGHKAIVHQVRNQGFEVYLAVDEFSWSKRTLPKLLRRKIVRMSTADQWDTYLFPDHFPVNIAMPEDLAALRRCFPHREVYLVVGSDVIRGASAYKTQIPGGAPYFHHILIHRAGQQDLPPVSHLLHGKVLQLEIPPQLETVSSTKIREFIDKNLDISALVDPIVQSYIYEYGLYLRTPMQKEVLKPLDYEFRTPNNETSTPEIFEYLRKTSQPWVAALYSRQGRQPLAWAGGHTLTTANLYDELKDVETCSAVRRLTSGRLLMIDRIEAAPEYIRPVVNELLVRSLSHDHTYALCRCKKGSQLLLDRLEQLGFIPVAGTEDLYCVDMRAPMVLIQDVLLCIKPPHRTAREVQSAIEATRPKLRRSLAALYPGKLLLCFDAELLNQSLMFKVQQHNGVLGMDQEKHLGKRMCVPYGKILSDEIVPNTVTKILHADKCFAPDGSNFSVVEYPGYSSLPNQVRTIKAFRRPVILVDDLLHKGYRISKLNQFFRQENLDISRVIVGILSGRGQDLMREQNRKVDCEYFIPNLHYWATESLLYPFIGGDSVSDRQGGGRMLPSLNLILPYFYPRHFADTSEVAIRNFSQAALENAHQILKTLEKVHQETFNTPLTLRRLGEALSYPRLPDRGRQLTYDLSVPASAYLEDDLLHLSRIRMRGEAFHGI